jgi:DNA-binding SARP family transcriptional activator
MFQRHHKTDMVLLHLILAHRRPVAREMLMETGWPEADPKVSSHNLNTTVSYLRKSLDAALGYTSHESAILHENDSYILNPTLRLRVDVEEFDFHQKRGLVFERRGQLNRAMLEYMESIALYKGELAIADIDSVTMLIERERLACAYLAVLGKVADHCLAQRYIEEAISFTFRILQTDPYREDAHRLLMRCFTRLGQRTQALRQFDLCSSLLQREYQIAPAPDTVALRQRIAEGEEA